MSGNKNLRIAAELLVAWPHAISSRRDVVPGGLIGWATKYVNIGCVCSLINKLQLSFFFFGWLKQDVTFTSRTARFAVRVC